MPVTIGISGKRYIAAGERKNTYNAILKELQAIVPNKQEEVIGLTSLASGADTLFATVILENYPNAKLHIALPFALEEYSKDFRDEPDPEAPDEKRTERQVLEEYIRGHGVNTVVAHAIPQTDEERNEAYYAAGLYIADKCDEMIFVWDKVKPNGRGGTAEILGYYAETRPGKTIHMVHVSPRTKDELNDRIEAEMNKADQAAIEYKKLYKDVWWAAIRLGFLAVVLFAIKVGYHFHHSHPHDTAGETDGRIPAIVEFALTYLELFTVLRTWWLIRKARMLKYHAHYLQQRMKSEKLRGMLTYNLASLPVDTDDDITHSDQDVAAIADEMNKVANSTKYHSLWFTQYAVKELITGQIAYHTKTINKTIGNRPHKYEQGSKAVAIAFGINILYLFAYTTAELLHKGHWTAMDISHINICYWLHIFAISLTIILPALYAAIEGALYFNEWNMLKEQSKTTKRELERYLTSLPSVTNTPAGEKGIHEKQVQVLMKATTAMLADNKTWHRILGDKGISIRA
ncbi:hypothetical protein GCM10023093_27150 [Nemorincola caseinilytica]|uniref:SMODS and SLOG-associating 2TM effector domain-containing protein n=1 Tax=Nemorincola caseinilytica TaxID=2054315 RepID=A0ABP8NPS0_9BACT